MCFVLLYSPREDIIFFWKIALIQSIIRWYQSKWGLVHFSCLYSSSHFSETWNKIQSCLPGFLLLSGPYISVFLPVTVTQLKSLLRLFAHYLPFPWLLEESTGEYQTPHCAFLTILVSCALECWLFEHLWMPSESYTFE